MYDNKLLFKTLPPSKKFFLATLLIIMTCISTKTNLTILDGNPGGTVIMYTRVPVNNATLAHPQKHVLWIIHVKTVTGRLQEKNVYVTIKNG